MFIALPRYGGKLTEVRPSPCTRCASLLLWLIVVASESARKAFGCLLFALEHTRFWPFWAEFRHEVMCPQSKLEVRQRYQRTEASVLMTCKWFRPEFRQELSRGSLGAGEVLKIVLGGHVKNMALGTFFAAQDQVLDKGISS